MVARSWAERVMERIYTRLGYQVISVGMPDFILLKDEFLVFVEIKTENDRPSEGQKRAVRLLKEHGYKARIERITCEKSAEQLGHHKITAHRDNGEKRVYHQPSPIIERLLRKNQS